MCTHCDYFDIYFSKNWLLIYPELSVLCNIIYDGELTGGLAINNLGKLHI